MPFQCRLGSAGLWLRQHVVTMESEAACTCMCAGRKWVTWRLVRVVTSSASRDALHAALCCCCLQPPHAPVPPTTSHRHRPAWRHQPINFRCRCVADCRWVPTAAGQLRWNVQRCVWGRDVTEWRQRDAEWRQHDVWTWRRRGRDVIQRAVDDWRDWAAAGERQRQQRRAAAVRWTGRRAARDLARPGRHPRMRADNECALSWRRVASRRGADAGRGRGAHSPTQPAAACRHVGAHRLAARPISARMRVTWPQVDPRRWTDDVIAGRRQRHRLFHRRRARWRHRLITWPCTRPGTCLLLAAVVTVANEANTSLVATNAFVTNFVTTCVVLSSVNS